MASGDPVSGRGGGGGRDGWERSRKGALHALKFKVSDNAKRERTFGLSALAAGAK